MGTAAGQTGGTTALLNRRQHSRGLDADGATSALLTADAIPNSQGGDSVAIEKGEPALPCPV